jgi:HAE1 family hydrophobic/amphiphilic exporter-1
VNVARFSVTRPIAITMRIASLVLLGAICLMRLPIDLLPKVSLPTVVVITNWPNVSPEEVETQLTRPIEQAVSAVPNLYNVESRTVAGSSLVRVSFQWGTDIGQGAIDVLQLVERARQRFPNDPNLQAPVVFKFDPSQLPILIFGVRGESDPVKLRALLDNQISPIIESADGVASALVTGGQQRAIMIDIDPERLRAFHISLRDVNRRIAQENLNLPAGIARQSNTEYTIRSLGWFKKPEEIAKVPIGTAGGRIISLGDVATVRDEHPETRLYTRLNGDPAVGVIVTKQSGSNTVATAQAVLKKIEQIQKLYPGIEFKVAYNQAGFISDSIHDVTNSALIGGGLAILILLFFLRNVRSTLVVALSIPISIISTFALVYICGFTINTMSLGGLALATGLIVDDAVVVLENIFRHIERDNKSPAQAAVSGTNEIATAVLASTLTIMIVFLPLLLLRGQAGQMFTQFALVVIFSIAVSFIDAVTVTPMLASRIISGEAHHENAADGHKKNLLERLFVRSGIWFDALDASYRNGLEWTLRHRAIMIVGAILITGSSVLLYPLIGQQLMPPTDSGDFSVNVRMPPGTALEETNKVMKKVEAILLKHPFVATAFAATGTSLSPRGTTTALTSNIGAVTVKLKEERNKSTLDVIAELRKEFSVIPGAKIFPIQYDMVTNMLVGGNQNVEVYIFGDDLSTLYSTAKEVQQRIKGIAGLENIDISWQESAPEVLWQVDRDKASRMGLSFTDVAETINMATTGTIASYYQEGGFQYPIMVQVAEAKRRTVEDLQNLTISPPAGVRGAGEGILLSQVAKPIYGFGPSEVSRMNRQRYISVFGQPQGRSISEIQEDVEKALKDYQMPKGFYWDWGTTQRRRAEEFAGLGFAIFLAIGLIYMLLASQFESLIHPLTVLVSVPLSAIGVVLALFLTGRSFGLTAFIGLLMLVGIVVKNGILLVDYTNVLRSRGVPRLEAILRAGPTRLRPILMTTFAAVLGMLPIAIGIGKGGETQVPMATAVIGGLITSTLLTLFVVPTVYTILDDIERRFRKTGRDLSPAELIEPSLEALGATEESNPTPDTPRPVPTE